MIGHTFSLTGISAVLWDIDGTLLTSGGAVARTFLDAVKDVTGAAPRLEGIDFGGRLDPDIAGLLLASIGHGLDRVPDVLDRFRTLAAEREAALRGHVTPLPGVVPLLAALARAGVPQTVVTGNLETIGLLKLSAAGLIPPIAPELGGFGDAAATRPAVAQVALDRLTGAGWRNDPGTCWIIGDTPRDVACAQALGLRCALVATGRLGVQDLSGLGADVVLTGLGELDLEASNPAEKMR
jgi:phosphoglycolate phosphatase